MGISFREYKDIVHRTKDERMKKDTLYRLERNISVLISYFVARFLPAITPNFVSILSVLFLLPSFLIAFFQESLAWFLFAWLLLKFTTILDRVDGELARYKSRFTQVGIYYDRMYHSFYVIAFYSILVGSFAGRFEASYLWLLTIILIALALHFSLIGKIRNHIKYKIKLENHENEIQDVLPLSRPAYTNPKLLNYLFTRWYDWSWLVALIVTTISYIMPARGFVLYAAYLSLSILYISFLLFYSYPKSKLFTAEELRN